MSTLTSRVLMVPPQGFAFNSQTSISNDYQKQPEDGNYRDKAMNEFNKMVKTLEKNDIRVLLLHQDEKLPDAVFPNNWFSTHIDANNKRLLMIYPMLAENRQSEVNIEGLMQLLNNHKLNPHNIIDLRERDYSSLVLEGTGSIVFDRASKILYASLSPRTDLTLVNRVADKLGYKAVTFTSQNLRGHSIYHTNVMMSVGDTIAVICSSCIQEPAIRVEISKQLEQNAKVIIEITPEQVESMCGNVLELVNASGQRMLVMSQTAYENFTPLQIKDIESKVKIIPVGISTIENIGGGSARCMMAEIF